ncbi:MAG TPA: hypothetical protein DCW37_05940 [Cellvibrionales bacterium]|nr:hypothetical protein [Cellvibrionales bacterium]
MKKSSSIKNAKHLPLLTLVTSNQNLQDVLHSSIDAQRYQLLTANTASEGLTIIDGQPQTDGSKNTDVAKIALIDLILEDMDGLSFIEELRARHRGLHIIAIMCKKELAAIDMSAENITLMASKCGANAVFTAPFNLAELLATIDRFLEASAVIDTANANKPATV